MNYFKQLYLRIFKGFTRMPELDARIVRLWFLGSERAPEFIRLPGGDWLVSKPGRRKE